LTFFVGFLLSLALSIMAPSKFTPDPAFFGDPDGICGLEMAKLAGFSYGEVPTALLPLVVSGSLPTPAKGKLQYGHHVSKATSKNHGSSSPFFCATPTILHAQLEKETLEWNPVAVATPEFPFERLNLLRSKPIGGILAVFTHFDEKTKTFGTPVLRVVACPAVATLGVFSAEEPPGFNLHDIWDPAESPLSDMPTSETSCPMMVSAGGFSRHTWPATVANFLVDSQPLFLPSGELVASTVAASGVIMLRAYFLPSHAHLPVGMAWKLAGLTLAIMQASIVALMPDKGTGATVYEPFKIILDKIATLAPWLIAVQADPSSFAIQAFSFDHIQDHFPDLVTGASPASITDSSSFAPLMDLRYLFAWRLLLDKMMSGISREDIAHMSLFLSRIATCLHPDTYMGVKLPVEMCPNLYFHFKPHGGYGLLAQHPILIFLVPNLSRPLWRPTRRFQSKSMRTVRVRL
jgi:hypothetical protein